MGEKKETLMILKVNLQCDRCYKRVKKVLCKFHEIRDRVFDEKSNTVVIKVVSCDPEKIRHKLCNKGRGSIKTIEIEEPKKPVVKPPPVVPPKPPPVVKPVSKPQPPATCCEECYYGRPGGPCNYGYGPPPGYYYGYYYGRMGYNGYGPGGPTWVCRPGCCAEYFSEENAVGCSVM